MCKDHVLGNALSVQVPDSPLLGLSPKPPVATRQTRYKLWELQNCWHCMVVGTCLTLAEVRQAASKARVPLKHKSDYDIHQLAVESAADKQNPLTQRLQKLLEKKFALTIKQFRAARTATALRDHWLEGWESGEVASSLWALITHPASTRDVVLEVFGQVHMLSHLSGASVCVDRRLRLKQESRNTALNSELKTLRGRYDKTSTMLREQTLQLEAEQANVRALQASLDKVKEQLQNALLAEPKTEVDVSHLVNPLREKNRELRQCLLDEQSMGRQQAAEIERLKRLLSSYECGSAEHEAEQLTLCGQCVLYLGGKAQQRRHFQALVESCDGRFLHHDGGRETCPHRISELVSQADVVMCPTDCISHGAMEKARSLCAKQDKPIVFMQRASLSSFTRGLQEVMADSQLT